MGTLMAEQALYARLTGHAGLSALIGTRLYPNVAPQNATMPYGVYQRISGPRDYHLGGSSRFLQALIQVSWVGGTYASAKACAEQARLAMDGYSGTVTSGSDSLVVTSAQVEDQPDATQGPSDAKEKPTYVVVHDITINCFEASS